jgi:hypothetical protein
LATVTKNGKETPQGRVLKYTAHELLKKPKQGGPSRFYEVKAARKHMKYGNEIH